MKSAMEKTIQFKDRHTFRLQDRLAHERYWWPETLLTYRLDFGDDSVNANSLALTDDSTGRQVPYQLSDVRADSSGRLLSASLSFMTDLGSGETRSFTLTKAEPDRFESPIRVTEGEDGLWIDNGVFAACIPQSRIYPVHIPGPILRIRASGTNLAGSRLDPGGLRIVEMITACRESGPLFAEYTVTYRFDEGKTYTATLRFIRGMEFVVLAEQAERIDERDGVIFRVNWSGLAPTHRHAPNNPAIMLGDYDTPYEDFNWDRIDEAYVGGYSHPIGMWSNSAEGEIPFRLSLYEPQASIVKVNAAAFWNEDTGQAVGAFIMDEAAWDDGKYDLFCSWDGFAVRFYYRDGLMWWKYPIVSGSRTTAIAVYGHEKDKTYFESVRPRRPLEAQYLAGATRMNIHGASHCMFLQIRYSLLSLDKIKDFVLEYPAAARACEVIFDDCPYPDPESFERFLTNYILVGSLPTHGGRANAGFSAVPYRRMVNFAKAYNRFKGEMAAPNRRRVEAILLLLTYLAAGEEVVPLLHMHGGPPNLHGDVKRALGYMATQFPEHPEAGHWRATFAKFVETSLRLYTRPDLPGLRLKGGRWAENVGTYTWAFLIPALKTAMLLERQSGMRNLFANPHAALLGKWLVHAVTAPFDGENEQIVRLMGGHNHYWGCFAQGHGPHRVYPPIGAHAARRTTPRSMRDFAERLERYDPILAENIHYICSDLPDDFESRSRETPKPVREQDRRLRGTRPAFATTAFTGYGVMLRGGVYTPSEVSVFLQQIDEGPNYRWGTAGMGGNGNIYYYAQGRAYSHQGKEDAGDRRLNDCEVGCNFGVWKGNRFASIGPNVLTDAYRALGTFQFASIASEKDGESYSYPEYLERSVLLSGTDYISVYDRTGAPSIRNRFTWSVSGYDEMPQIHLLNGCDYTGKLTTGNETSRTDCVWYEGSGDGFAIVSHRDDLKVEKRSYGAVVTAEGFRDTLLRSGYELDGEFDGVRFEGTAGAIRERDGGEAEVALIRGRLIAAKGVYLASEHGRVGISVRLTEAGELAGFVSGPGEDRIRVACEGMKAPCLYLNSVLSVPDEEGMHRVAAGEHTLQLLEGAELPVPAVPVVRNVVQGDGVCEVLFQEAAGATRYHVQISDDLGDTWREAAAATVCRIGGVGTTAETSDGIGGIAAMAETNDGIGGMAVTTGTSNGIGGIAVVMGTSDGIGGTAAMTGTYDGIGGDATATELVCRIGGLENGRKYFVRVCGANDRKRGEHSHEYPVYPSDRKPLLPEGLDVVIRGEDLDFSWGRVLGASRYRLYRLDRSGNRSLLYEGRQTRYACRRPASGEISRYTVSAVNLCGEGEASPHEANDDPDSMRNDKPLIDRPFQRNSLYGHHPFALRNAHRYREVPSTYPESVMGTEP